MTRSKSNSTASDIETYGKPQNHFEAKLYKKDKNLAFFYITSNLHQHRLNMIAEQIRQIASKSDKQITMLNLGCGTGELETKLTDLNNLYKIGVDVSAAALKAGKNKKLFDRIIAVDVMSEEFSKIKFPKSIDIIVAAEILEHIPHPGIFIKQKIYSLQKKGDYFLGSVPNISQIYDVIGLFTGRGDSYQTTRPLMDSTSGHISFFSLHSLQRVLSFAGYDHISISGNGVRLFRKGDFGFKMLSKITFLKQYSDRFVFSCRKLI